MINGHLSPVYTLLYTLPGVPSIYYGSEWGIEGRKANGGDPVACVHILCLIGNGASSECAGTCRVSCIPVENAERKIR